MVSGQGNSTREDGRRERVLRFWRSVELFGTPTLDPPDNEKHRYQIRPGQPLPWQDGHPLRRKSPGKDRVWRHTVYGGVFALDRLHSVLEQVFGDSGPDVDERVPRGHTALFAVVMTEDGRLLLDSLVLSTAAWALGRALRPGPAAADWLNGFDAAANGFTTAARESVAADEDDAVAAALAEDGVIVSRPVGPASLLALVRLATDKLGVAEALGPDGLRVHSEAAGRKRAHDLQVDFLNSFYIEDLARVGDAVAAGDCGPALAAYLATDDAVSEIRRLDVRDPAVEDTVLEQLAPTWIPAGRWPAKASHPLATSQQLAINTIVQRLGGQAGLFAVNGPPGTGKTTMLRDLVAAVVVERASRLAALDDPETGFEARKLAWRTDRNTRWIRPLRADLTGFEIVVASANNGAVANVTREIPQRKAIDDEWAGQANYLTEHATRLLGEPAWGLIAARLGNKTNCGEFASRVWYGDPADPTNKHGEEGPGLKEYLNGATRAHAGDWSRVRVAFRAAVAAEQDLRRVRQAAHTALRQLPALQQADEAAQSALQMAQRGHAAAVAAARSAEQAAAAAEWAAQGPRGRRREHLVAKPGVWEMLFTFGRAIRRWHIEDEPLAAALAGAEAAVRATTAASAAARRTVAEAVTQVASVQAHQKRTADAVTQAHRTLDTARRDVAADLPDDEWRADSLRKELSGPWLDEAWNAARTRVFLAALDLHTAFLSATAATMSTNLQVAIDVLKGQAPPDTPERTLRQAWQCLFLVVPVVSTTFASVSRMLGRLGSQALGWLLIDEAGQAAPQAAVGGIWRARRVVAVGDPLQLEPIVTALHTTQAALARHHHVPDSWLPGGMSVQQLSDRVTSLGTWLPGPDHERVWVGAPLRVHRRCDNPMFDVINTAVYGGLMIHGTSPHRHPLPVRDSAWIDVKGTDADGNWITAEGEAMQRVLDYLAREGISQTQLMAIGPFRDTARHLKHLLTRSSIVHGTVHTAQGKEADIVLFILGGNPNRPGARHWATAQPNLFNVAISRARQRLYVIGDHASWAKLPYFSALARELPIRPIRPRTSSAAD